LKSSLQVSKPTTQPQPQLQPQVLAQTVVEGPTALPRANTTARTPGESTTPLYNATSSNRQQQPLAQQPLSQQSQPLAQQPQKQARGDNRNWTEKAADVVDKAKATITEKSHAAVNMAKGKSSGSSGLQK